MSGEMVNSPLEENKNGSERDEVRRAGSQALGSLGENVSGQRGP